MKKKAISLLYVISISLFSAYAQVPIGTAVPDHSAALEITSTTKGLLIPRMTTSQRGAIKTPADGLQVYDTTTKSMWYYNGTAWINIPLLPNDASSTAKGIIKLAADLSGTAVSPIIANNSITTDKIKDGTISNIDLLNGSGGIYKGSGALSGNTIVTGENKTLSINGTSSNIFSVDGSTFSVNATNHAVGIGTNTPDSKAILELNSNTKGFLLPRMTTAERNLITSPPDGLIIYNVNTDCIEVYNVSQSLWFNTCSYDPSGNVFQIIGDIKYGLQTADHDGWVLLDGRSISVLTASQQANAQSLGIVSNLPDPRGRIPMGAGASYSLLSKGGSNIITRKNLPNVNIGGSSPYVPIGKISSNYTSSSTVQTTLSSHNHSLIGNSGWDGGINNTYIGFSTNTNNTLSVPSVAHSHSISLPIINSVFQGSSSLISFNNIPLNNNQTQSVFQPSYLALSTFLYLGM